MFVFRLYSLPFISYFFPFILPHSFLLCTPHLTNVTVYNIIFISLSYVALSYYINSYNFYVFLLSLSLSSPYIIIDDFNKLSFLPIIRSHLSLFISPYHATIFSLLYSRFTFFFPFQY